MIGAEDLAVISIAIKCCQQIKSKKVFNSLTPKTVLVGTKNSHLEGFWLAKHKNTNIPTMMGSFPPPAAWFLWKNIPHPREPLCKRLGEAAVEGF